MNTNFKPTDSEQYFIGIDGGGTSCRARIRDASGQLFGEGKSGSANILLGVQPAMDSIMQAIATAAEQSGLSHNDYPRMHLGLALAGAEQKEAWAEFMRLAHPFASTTLNTDAYGACLGAHDGDDGAIMIAGTGSCGIYIQGNQQIVVGGHEFPISDQGSGAVMGLHLIQQTLLAYNGIRKLTPMAQHVLDHFGNSIDNIVSWSKTARPRDYGQFCPKVFELAYQGDALALELLKQTAADIEMHLVALNRHGATRIALMGSIAERIGKWLSPPVQEWIVTPKNDAIEGAIMMAGRPEHNLYELLEL